MSNFTLNQSECTPVLASNKAFVFHLNHANLHVQETLSLRDRTKSYFKSIEQKEFYINHISNELEGLSALVASNINHFIRTTGEGNACRIVLDIHKKLFPKSNNFVCQFNSEQDKSKPANWKDKPFSYVSLIVDAKEGVFKESSGMQEGGGHSPELFVVTLYPFDDEDNILVKNDNASLLHMEFTFRTQIFNSFYESALDTPTILELALSSRDGPTVNVNNAPFFTSNELKPLEWRPIHLKELSEMAKLLPKVDIKTLKNKLRSLSEHYKSEYEHKNLNRTELEAAIDIFLQKVHLEEWILENEKLEKEDSAAALVLKQTSIFRWVAISKLCLLMEKINSFTITDEIAAWKDLKDTLVYEGFICQINKKLSNQGLNAFKSEFVSMLEVQKSALNKLLASKQELSKRKQREIDSEINKKLFIKYSGYEFKFPCMKELESFIQDVSNSDIENKDFITKLFHLVNQEGLCDLPTSARITPIKEIISCLEAIRKTNIEYQKLKKNNWVGQLELLASVSSGGAPLLKAEFEEIKSLSNQSQENSYHKLDTNLRVVSNILDNEITKKKTEINASLTKCIRSIKYFINKNKNHWETLKIEINEKIDAFETLPADLDDINYKDCEDYLNKTEQFLESIHCLCCELYVKVASKSVEKTKLRDSLKPKLITTKTKSDDEKPNTDEKALKVPMYEIPAIEPENVTNETLLRELYAHKGNLTLHFITFQDIFNKYPEVFQESKSADNNLTDNHKYAAANAFFESTNQRKNNNKTNETILFDYVRESGNRNAFFDNKIDSASMSKNTLDPRRAACN